MSMTHLGVKVSDCTCGAGEQGHAPDCAFIQTTCTVRARYQEDTQSCAREFSRLLRKWLTEDQMTEVVALNKAETNPNVCHSHDFCDANMAMLDACEGQEVPTHVDDDYGALVWDAAWSLAKSVNFFPMKVA